MVFQGEFRKNRRQAMSLLAGVEGANNIDFAHKTKIRNINAIGMAIETFMKLSIGDKKHMRFFLNGGDSLTVQCRVIWRKLNADKNMYGLMFSDLNLWKKIKLKRFLAKKRTVETLFA